MKFGFPLSSGDERYLEKMVEHADFFELKDFPGADFSFLEGFDVPVIVHAAHQRWKVNTADPKLSAINTNALVHAMETASRLNSRHVILHPGFIGNPGCSLEAFISFLDDFSKKIPIDGKVLIENMPPFLGGLDGAQCIGSAYNEMASILANTGLDMCLDLDHSSETAFNLGKDVLEYGREFLKLNPKHFHMCDLKAYPNPAYHLSFGEGELNIEALIGIIPKSAWVTLETSMEPRKQMNDIRIARELARK